MKLDKAVELLQGAIFNISGSFSGKLSGDVDPEYTLRPVDTKHFFKVVDAETLINNLYIDLDEITKEIDLYNEVEEGLCNIIVEIGIDGVELI